MENLPENVKNLLSGFGDKTILLVEDEETYLKFTAKVIEKYLHSTVISCTNPKEAFEYLNNAIPDLIIMDLQMPVMDGLTALKYIRASERTAKIPVIICSALGFESILKTMSQLGVSEFIVKPADASVIVKKITKVLRSVTNETEQ
jgi:CheY-like chemotaxis protein